jgi:hypothetical protein
LAISEDEGARSDEEEDPSIYEEESLSETDKRGIRDDMAQSFW